MNTEVLIVNAFSIDGTGGNPAGVVLNADRYSREQKQAIAAAAGLSETAFVSASETEDFQLHFFTPTRQIAHCGHATIGVFSLLRQLGLVTKQHASKETIDGPRQIHYRGDRPFMEQSDPVFTPLDDLSRDRVLTSLGIKASDLEEAPLIAHTGNGFLLVPLKEEAALKAVSADAQLIHELSDQFDLIGFYVFVRGVHDGYDASARMFGPRYGIPEESATGMAAGPLACYLHSHAPKAGGTYLIRQGDYMETPSPSRIEVHVRVDEKGSWEVWAGGDAYTAGKLEVALAEAPTELAG